MDSGEDTTHSANGLLLHYQWQRIAKPRGVMLIVHGICEHIGRYRALEDWFCGQGFTCYGFDQRGHGQSAGRRTHVAGFSEYVDDLHIIVALARERENGLPVFIFSHSMGAVVALLSVLRDPAGCRGLITASPAVALGPVIPGWIVKLGGLLGALIPTIKVPSLIGSRNLSHDPDIIAAYEQDNLVEDSVTLGWLASMLNAQDEVFRLAPRIKLPVLVLHSRADPVTAISGTRRLVGRMPQEKATLREYARPYHELHNEIASERDAVLNDVAEWLNGQVMPQPA